MQAVGYEGLVGIGYRYDARVGLYKVLNVNPRVSGVFRLFEATNGMDVVRIGYLDVTGQAVAKSAFSVGRKRMLDDDFDSAFTYARRGELALKQWLASLEGREGNALLRVGRSTTRSRMVVDESRANFLFECSRACSTAWHV
jgi:predicted ATP-grasp superfamily ATP-dependent carboligase